ERAVNGLRPQEGEERPLGRSLAGVVATRAARRIDLFPPAGDLRRQRVAARRRGKYVRTYGQPRGGESQSHGKRADRGQAETYQSSLPLMGRQGGACGGPRQTQGRPS